MHDDDDHHHLDEQRLRRLIDVGRGLLSQLDRRRSCSRCSRARARSPARATPRSASSTTTVAISSASSRAALASGCALWSPPEKVVGRCLAPYLSTARPGRLKAAALVERAPAPAGRCDARAAVTLALNIAAMEDCSHNRSRALQALAAAGALEPDRDGQRPRVRRPGGRS